MTTVSLTTKHLQEYLNLLANPEEPADNECIHAAEDNAQELRMPPPSAEDLGWINYSLHDEEEGMAFRDQCSEE
jgi:hypothetical protein